MSLTFRIAAWLTFFACALAQATEIYFTDFEEFPVGPDQLAGTDGWLGNNIGQGIHGIDENIVVGLGNTAFLGSAQPSSPFTTVFRQIDHDPVAHSTPTVEFESFIGIQDSTNGRRDRFFIAFYNIAGNFLAALEFNNTEEEFGVWRLDGSNRTYTGDIFFRNVVMFLNVRIDYARNVWSASLDDVQVFQNQTFNLSGQTLDLGAVAAEWLLSSSSTVMWGTSGYPIACEESRRPKHEVSEDLSTQGHQDRLESRNRPVSIERGNEPKRRHHP